MGNKIKYYAKNRGIKLDVLAEKTGISKTTIYSIARGSSIPNLLTAYKISKVLDVKIEEIFFNE